MAIAGRSSNYDEDYNIFDHLNLEEKSACSILYSSRGGENSWHYR
jgi:hypothetical protein